MRDSQKISAFGVFVSFLKNICDLEGIRTPNPLLRRQMLYPIELRNHSFMCIKKHLIKVLQNIITEYIYSICLYSCTSTVENPRSKLGFPSCILCDFKLQIIVAFSLYVEINVIIFSLFSIFYSLKLVQSLNT